MDGKRSMIDLIWYVVEDTARCARFVVVVLVLALAAGLGLHVWL